MLSENLKQYEISSWLYFINYIGFLIFLVMLINEMWFTERANIIVLFVSSIAEIWAIVCFIILRKTKLTVGEYYVNYTTIMHKEKIPINSIKYAYSANFQIGIDIGKKYRKVIPYIFKDSSKIVELLNVYAEMNRKMEERKASEPPMRK